MYSFKNNLLRTIQAGGKSLIKNTNLEKRIRPCFFNTIAYRKCLPSTHVLQIRRPPIQCLHTYSPTIGNKVLEYVKQKWHSLRNWNRQKEIFIGLYLYQSMEQIKYREFFSALNLPDTFQSWFLITELHVWMLLVRLQMEGEDGRIVRNSVIESFYEDAFRRAKLLEPLDAVKIKKQVFEMCQDLRVAFFLYDEGLLNDDKLLAGALWYQFFKIKCDDPRHLEILIQYIRHQIQILRNWSSADILDFNRTKSIWTSIKPHVKNVYSS